MRIREPAWDPTRDGKAVTNGAPSKAASGQTPDVVRIASGGLVYSGISRQADFTGGFRAETVDGTIRAAQGTAFMKANPTHDGDAVMNGAPVVGAGTVPSPGEPWTGWWRAGHVVIDQPGLQATGERLVYTASDQVFLLTGTADAPPKATGAQGYYDRFGAAAAASSCDGSGGDSVEVVRELFRVNRRRRYVRIRASANDGKKEKGKR